MSHSRIFRYFKTSHEIIRLAVMMYVRYPLSLRNVEDLASASAVSTSGMRTLSDKKVDYRRSEAAFRDCVGLSDSTPRPFRRI
jgi:putative transposase